MIYVVWAAAVVHSFREYRKDRALESADAVAALAEVNAAVEPNVVSDVRPVAGEVTAGRPSAPQD